MPKMKSNSGAKKRFRQTARGHFKRNKAGKSHILTKKTTKRKQAYLRHNLGAKSSGAKRKLRRGAYVSKTQEHQIRAMLPYGTK